VRCALVKRAATSGDGRAAIARGTQCTQLTRASSPRRHTPRLCASASGLCASGLLLLRHVVGCDLELQQLLLQLVVCRDHDGELARELLCGR
tara:strand:- start:74 stop:349 length:276 start_codon:yes stop_codon:yes gene_type:complete